MSKNKYFLVGKDSESVVFEQRDSYDFDIRCEEQINKKTFNRIFLFLTLYLPTHTRTNASTYLQTPICIHTHTYLTVVLLYTPEQVNCMNSSNAIGTLKICDDVKSD